MNLTLSNALDISQLPIPYVISIEDDANADGSFVVASILEECVRQEQNMVLALFHNTIGHYHGIATKLGYNLLNLKDKSLQVIDAMQEIFKDNLTIDTKISLHNIYIKLKEFVCTFCNQEKTVTVVLEYPDNAIAAEGKREDLLFFIQHVRSLCRKNVHLVCLVRSNSLSALSCTLQHYSNLSIQVKGLKTGSAADLSGSLIIKRKHVYVEDKNQCHFHYQLLDKRVRIFAPGFVQMK